MSSNEIMNCILGGMAGIVVGSIIVLIVDFFYQGKERLRARLQRADEDVVTLCGEKLGLVSKVGELQRRTKVLERLLAAHAPGKCQKIEKPQRPEDPCKCGHTRSAHIYWEGPCRSGSAVACKCPTFSLELYAAEPGHPTWSGGVSS